MNEPKHVKTPAIKVVRVLGLGKAAIVELPVSYHHAILQLNQLPEELGFPLVSPRPVYAVMNPADNSFPGSGAHAHAAGTEKEIMFVPMGKALVYLWDRNGAHQVVELTPPEEGERMQALFIPDGIWHTVRYEPGTVLNVSASVDYDRSYYVEDPAEYFATEEAMELYSRTLPA